MGSISGVNLKRFRPQVLERRKTRLSSGIPDSATVFGFMGRLKKDKGVLELAQAFRIAYRESESAYLLVVGPDEEQLMQKMIDLGGESAQRMSFVSWTREPEKYMAAFDLLCLPSYREGFGSVIIEAAACGVPALASRIYGISDAVVEGVTGMMHQCGDVGGMAAGMRYAIEEKNALTEMGLRAQKRASQDFDQLVLSRLLVAYYRRVLEEWKAA